jgi:hypothetical protein
MNIVRTTIFIVLLFSSWMMPAQSGIEWSPPVNVSTTDGDKSPVIAAFDDGEVATVWGKGAAIYFSRTVDGTFLDPVVIPTPGITESIYAFGGLDMVIHDNSIFISFESFADGLFQIRSIDGGLNFEVAQNIFDPPTGKWATLSALAISENGNPMVSAILENTDETDARIVLIRSLDGGDTYEAEVIASEPARGDFVCECCTPDLITKGDDIWIVFRNNSNNLRDMWVSKSSDGGATFTEAIDVDETNWVINACPISGPKIAAMAGDSLISVWSSGADGSNKIYYSTLDGVHMEKGSEVNIPRLNANSFQSYPTVAGANDTVGMVWEESGFGANAGELIFALSKNGTTDLILNAANITQAPGSQRYPSLVFLNGVFHLFNTNGNGGLEYRRGRVSDVSAVENQSVRSMCFNLMEQPVEGGIIKLSTVCENRSEIIKAKLYDVLGNKIKEWHLNPSNNNHRLPVGSISTGMYILVLDINRESNVLNVIIQNN